MRLFPTLPHIARIGIALLAALAIAGCAEHKYLSGASYSDVPDVQKYSDDWFAAARAGRLDILQALIDAHFPLDAATSDGYTALILSAYDAHPDALKLLLSAGANACAADRHGNTALMGALFKGETDIATMLLDTHCNIDQTNNAGETALSFAALFGRLDMLPALVAHGANPNHVDARGITALQTVLNQGNTLAAEALRRVGAKQ
jgi:ankyrin repeat protein